MEYSIADHQHMAHALQLARNGWYSAHPNPRVGCVIVKDGERIGEGWHHKTGEAHAEVNALRAAGEGAAGATVYVTLEPCCHHGRTPPCSNALIDAGIKRVIAAMTDPHQRVAGQGLQQLREAGIEVHSGLLESQARELNPGFIKRMEYGLPFVRSKLAMSLDGRTAMASGESKWITSSAARDDVQHLRAASSAIVTGVGTVLADDPALTVRLEGMARQPLRVVVDTNLSLHEDAQILKQPGETLVVTCQENAPARERLERAGAQVMILPSRNNVVDLQALMENLAQMEINEVLLETGATLSGSMLEAGLIDEMVIYMAPLLMGDSARGLFRLPQLVSMADKIPLHIHDVRAVGADWRITARPVKHAVTATD